MPRNMNLNPLLATALTMALAAPTGAFAYDEDSATRDCEKRLRDEYKLSDFRHQSAEKLPGEGHQYIVKGETKIEGEKHPFGCDIADGYKAGAEDGKASMSMAYERHEGDYDTRFEPYYKRGYEKGWSANR